ncbi:hypothetical protein BIY27_17905 [Gibbsiella quercinecans]|uniref:SPOR domain-containing protein n=1 Tax=Gibbsiella quercinecans TaxID=929813 RepID=UPI000EF20287|nr:SPOR domain-containing protein [Gibbsiella quercinecans]RLM07834.1 hypothetical protein BIY27_17905 [Gibbsiella quercinecans]
MDEFKPEDDLRPDSSDRPTRSRKPAPSGPRFAVSRQHLMIGIGILVLLLIVIGIGAALKAPTKHEANQAQPGASRDINLAGSSSLTTANEGGPGGTTDTHDANGVSTSSQPQNISVPPIASTPTEAQPLPPQGGAQQRVELPGNMTDALSQQQGAVDSAAQGAVSTLPTAPATVMSGAAAREATRPVHSNVPPQPHKAPAKPAGKPAQAAAPHRAPATVANAPAPARKPAPTAASTGGNGTIQSAPGSHFTLQLSSASRSDTLNAFARQQKLKNYLVYETQRNGKPWYVLVNGVYASSADAKRAVAALPADVQAQKPWARPIRQVQQDIKK